MHVIHSNEEHPDEMEQAEQGKMQNVQMVRKRAPKSGMELRMSCVQGDKQLKKWNKGSENPAPLIYLVKRN